MARGEIWGTMREKLATDKLLLSPSLAAYDGELRKISRADSSSHGEANSLRSQLDGNRNGGDGNVIDLVGQTKCHDSMMWLQGRHGRDF
jgi:hypothetical protein